MASAEASVNIALVKYWGKRNIELNLPCASSLSMTLQTMSDVDCDLRLTSRTSVMIADRDTLILNGKETSVNPRISRMLDYVRQKTALGPVKIESKNFFPTAAGLASSASGCAALAKALSALISLSESDLQTIARLGSGSACRSLEGGFVKMNIDGSIERLFNHDHWPSLSCSVFVIEEGKKRVPSGLGMQATVVSSELFKKRLDLIDGKIDSLINAIERRDFPAFAEIVMRDSNQFHAVCLDTYPPLLYLNGSSYKIIDAVHNLNNMGKTIAAYTFDAGPNAFVFYQREDRSLVEEAIRQSLDKTPAIVRCQVGPGAQLIDKE